MSLSGDRRGLTEPTEHAAEARAEKDGSRNGDHQQEATEHEREGLVQEARIRGGGGQRFRIHPHRGVEERGRRHGAMMAGSRTAEMAGG